jgi:hypothetical protein
VALKHKEGHLWTIRFSSYVLGILNELAGKIARVPTKLGEEL